MNIDQAIRLYSSFLNESWNTISQLLLERDYTSDENSINDWLQCNWEMLVERKVLKLDQYLDVYGDGADYNGQSSRITDINAQTNFCVIVISLEKIEDILNNEEVEPIGLIFDRLVGFEKQYYTYFPPFDFVLARDEKMNIERIFSIKNIKFELRPI